jgi:histidine ammonia-lyase
LRQLRGALGQVGIAGLGQGLHPLREANRVADRGVLTAALGADHARHHLARVDPDPGREVEAVLAAKLGRVLRDVIEHSQRRVAGAPGVVLVGDRRPEHGHDPVAGEFVDGALEAVNRIGEDREEALHDSPPLLGVLLLGHVHRALDVGEQHGDELALALDSLGLACRHRSGNRSPGASYTGP